MPCARPEKGRSVGGGGMKNYNKWNRDIIIIIKPRYMNDL